MDLSASIVRTAVPYIIGYVVTLFGTIGINLSPDFKANLSAILTFVIGTIYYIVVRQLEKKYPKLGILLGIPVQPSYSAPEIKG